MSKTTDNIESTCVLCCQNVKFYAVGHCDHPVCYKCSTRMRVLSNQKYCAVCRTDLDEVLFEEKPLKFASISYQNFPVDRKYQIFFQNSKVKIAFQKLLEHQCKICKIKTPENIKTFKDLKDHMRKCHELFYCDLCVSNLQSFSSERRYYNRSELARHRRIGDPEDKSHKGHPLCEFCDERYLDNDELLKHLRREHFFCHFCDVVGSHQYYSDYSILRDHFRESHFLCEEGTCKDEQFTSAFQTEIDLKAHAAVRHSSKMSKAEAKQARHLDVEFNYTPRNAGYSRRHEAGLISGDDYQEVFRSHQHPARTGRSRGRGRRREDIESEMDHQTSLAMAASWSDASSNQAAVVDNSQRKKTTSSQTTSHQSNTEHPGRKKTANSDVPSLKSADDPAPRKKTPVSSRRADVTERKITGHSVAESSGREKVKKTPKEDKKDKLKKELKSASVTSKESTPKVPDVKSSVEYPDMNKSPKVMKSNKLTSDNKKEAVAVSPSLAKKVAAANHMSVQNGSLQEEEFPTLGGSAQGKTNTRQTSWTNHRMREEDFPPVNVSNPKKGASGKKKEKKDSSKKIVSSEVKIVKKSDAPVVDYTRVVSDKASEHGNKKAEPKVKAPKQAKSLVSTSSVDDFPSLSSIAFSLTTEKHKQRKVTNPPPGFSSASKKSATSSPLVSAASPAHRSSPVESSTVKKPTAPPPGLQKIQIMEKSMKSRAPPGFGSISATPVVSTNPVMRTTNVENIAPVMKAQTNSVSYTQPDNFQQRNQKLIMAIKNGLQHDTVKFEEFKTMSGQFRQGLIQATDYYTKCQNLLGLYDFSKVFSELVALLPDNIKQQQLLAAHNDFKVRETAKSQEQKYPDVLKISNVGKKKKSTPRSAWNTDITQWLTCPACKQVLSTADFNSHVASHDLDSDFPALSSTTVSMPPSTAGAWVKGK
ncbi:E3 ubiquitin-protein ligase ZNF598-like [Saccoglossus kowalevskii]|uniref:RING-type E3 ubiquitin transferase n=1 Tax=Saccoglossus kowalevskii TaxID=10224 RepID=A0ABM0MFS9_SACKO|nr:PREDICTED: zinc finger protein 598-like [Saccoglossus kowalevskii]